MCQDPAGGFTRYFNGKIDDVRYYQSKALTLAEVGTIYNSGNGTEDDKPSGDPENMTLISEKTVASLAPSNARIVILEEDVDSITLNTDLVVTISRDDGVNWLSATLTEIGDYNANTRVLAGNADFTGSDTGTDMIYRIQTLNNKNAKMHGVGLSWD